MKHNNGRCLKDLVAHWIFWINWKHEFAYMAIVVIRQDQKIEAWKTALKRRSPEIEVYSYLEPHPRDHIKMAMVWKPPHGIFSQYPKLECISSFGAGVDFLFEAPELPALPITRVVDPVLASDMSEFVIGAIMAHLKNFNIYKAEQLRNQWNPKPYKRINQVRVGIMGMGELGTTLAIDLMAMGFRVSGWANSKKDQKGMSTFAGEDELPGFLSETDILVCLLPLTKDTKGILNARLFKKLPQGAYVINVARGGHLNDDELLEMLNNGHLSGAFLDVFHKEPLENSHPFWQHPKIDMTPHIASVSDIDSVVPQLLENYTRLLEGKPLINIVSRDRGY